jgi:hypothetical protein
MPGVGFWRGFSTVHLPGFHFWDRSVEVVHLYKSVEMEFRHLFFIFE